MFTYYGTKKKISKLYPQPRYDTIIEPFCGAAMYSLYGNNWQKNVILNDKFEKVFVAWDFLINKATENDIMNLPDLTEGLNLDALNISYDEKVLLGFYANPASAVPKKTVSKRGEISWERHKKFILENLHKVKHWKIFNMDYRNIPNEEATWFIDPPYQFGGQYYHSTASNKLLDYNSLRDWCYSRNGEIIVCENDKATWIPGAPLTSMNGQLHKTTEILYYKNNVK